MDDVVPLEETSKVAALFPKSTLVIIAESGHETVSWSACAASLASQFIETMRVGDVRCTMTPETVYPAVGRFPVVASGARPADIDPAGHNQVGVGERKAVTVAVAAAVDALQRSTIGSGSDHCLRSGLFTTTFTQSRWTSTLTNCSFTTDVSVTGTVVWGADRRFTADIMLSGSGTARGTIHVDGTWQAPGPVGNFHVSGRLGRMDVALLVPEA
jgi:hypothetical protein